MGPPLTSRFTRQGEPMGQGAGTQTHVGAQPRTYTHTRHNAQPQGTVTLSHVGTGNV